MIDGHWDRGYNDCGRGLPSLTTFTSSQIRVFSDLVRTAYEGIQSPAMWSEMLASIRKVVPTDAGAVILMDPVSHKPTDCTLLDVEVSMFDDYREHYANNDFISKTALVRGVRVWKPTDIVDKHMWQNSEICTDFLGKRGLGWPVSMMIGSGKDNLAQVYLARSKHRDDFVDEAVEFLRLLQPHFTNAFYIAKRNQADAGRACDISICAYGLSQREAEICRMLVRGMSNRAIAERLFISEFTVKDHVKSILGKLQVSKRSEVAARILGF